MEEVRFDRMVPRDVLARREACSLAFLPVGSLEWHGPHMPFGTDYMTVDYLAQEAARRYGGVVFPPVYYGDVRYMLQECRAEWRQTASRDLEVPVEWLAALGYDHHDENRPEPSPTMAADGRDPAEPLGLSLPQMERYFTGHLARLLLEIHMYGFRNIILLPGHGPNPRYTEPAQTVYRENVLRYPALGEPARTMSWFYILAAYETEPLLKQFWIHADKWEGSLTMVAAPGTVHPENLPAPGDGLVPAYLGRPYLTETDGYNPEFKHLWEGFDTLDPRNDTNEEYGRKQWEGILEIFGAKIAEFLGGEAGS
jgi:creatinine amidohydrolase/Fe(II)-dependent formamide hydrolase-like protein